MTLTEIQKINLKRCMDECTITKTDICCYDCKLNKDCLSKCEHVEYRRIYRLCDYKKLREI